MFRENAFKGCTGIIIGTGPSLNVQEVTEAQERGAKLFGVNNTYEDFDLDVWTAIDPPWHAIYSPIPESRADKWHIDQDICDRYGYHHIPAKRDVPGLSTDPSFIHRGHSSGNMALGLAVSYGCETILLVGYDMSYGFKRRHYFNGLSSDAGEYPQQIRKYSTFGGLIKEYDKIAAQEDRPEIINCTPDSGLKSFQMGRVKDYV